MEFTLVMMEKGPIPHIYLILTEYFVSRDFTFLEKLFRPIVSDQNVTSGAVISDSDSEPEVSTIEEIGTGAESEQHPGRSIQRIDLGEYRRHQTNIEGLLCFLSLPYNKINNDSDRKPPQTFEEALNCQEKEMSADAMSEEKESFKKNKVFEVQELPEGRKTVKCKWVYDRKRDSEGNIVRYKARLVARGFTRVAGIDYQEVLSPVTKSKTFRFLIGYSAAHGYELEQIDIKTAF